MSNASREIVERTTAELFEIIWRNLVEVIGTAAAANLLRRSARCAASHGALVQGLKFERIKFEYAYELPPEWRSRNPRSVESRRSWSESTP